MYSPPAMFGAPVAPFMSVSRLTRTYGPSVALMPLTPIVNRIWPVASLATDTFVMSGAPLASPDLSTYCPVAPTVAAATSAAAATPAATVHLVMVRSMWYLLSLPTVGCAAQEPLKAARGAASRHGR